MVGLDFFRDWFKGFEDQYVLIGGAACLILFNDARLAFRETRDLDMVLLLESLTPDFGQKFWEYIELADYQNRQRSTGSPEFFRFYEANRPGFPSMIELLSQAPEYISVPSGAKFTPIHLGDDLESLSAILLDKDYYSLVREGRTVINGLSVLKPPYLIILKMKAWLNLSETQEQNRHAVQSRDLNKHKNDVIRLTRLLTEEDRDSVALPRIVYDDLLRFAAMLNDEYIEPRQFGIKVSKQNVLGRIMLPFRVQDEIRQQYDYDISL